MTAQTLIKMAANLEPIGSANYPEASKTGLAWAHQIMCGDVTTMMLFIPMHLRTAGW